MRQAGFAISMQREIEIELQPAVAGTGAQAHDVAAMFHEFDTDGSGDLDMDEVRVFCQKLGKKLNNRMCARAFREMDKDGSGRVDLGEFTAWWEQSVLPATGTFHLFLLEHAEKRRLRKVELALLRGESIHESELLPIPQRPQTPDGSTATKCELAEAVKTGPRSQPRPELEPGGVLQPEPEVENEVLPEEPFTLFHAGDCTRTALTPDAVEVGMVVQLASNMSGIGIIRELKRGGDCRCRVDFSGSGSREATGWLPCEVLVKFSDDQNSFPKSEEAYRDVIFGLLGSGQGSVRRD